MANRDKLEEFIKKEVNRIEFDDENSMWEEFHGIIKKEKPESKKTNWYWPLFLFTILFVAIGSFYLGINYEKTTSSLTSSSSILSHKISPKQQLKKEDKRRILDERSSNLNSTNTYNKNTGNTISDAPTNRNLKEHLELIKKNITSKRYTQSASNSVVLALTQMHEILNPGKKAIETFKEMTNENVSAKNAGLEPITLIETRKISLQAEKYKLQLDPVLNESQASKVKRPYLSVESSFAKNNIRQHALGIGKYFPVAKNYDVKLQAGGSFVAGYSFSQDSILVLNGISIEEKRKDKDLKNIWNAYLDLGIFHTNDNWILGGGIKGNYALFNQFFFQEEIRIINSGTFNNAIMQSTEKVESGNWNGLNRVSLDTYLEAKYHINPNYSIGIYAEKRLNKLIKEEMANQAYSNIPVKFGVVLNKYF